MGVLKSLDWLEGRVHVQKDTLIGTLTIAPTVEKILKPSTMVSMVDVKKARVKDYEGGEVLVGAICYPSNYTLPTQYTNVFSEFAVPPIMKNQAVSVLFRGLMDVSLEEDFQDPQDYNQNVYLLTTGKISKNKPSTGLYYIVGKLKQGTGKQVVVKFDFEISDLMDATKAPDLKTVNANIKNLEKENVSAKEAVDALKENQESLSKSIEAILSTLSTKADISAETATEPKTDNPPQGGQA